MQLDLGQKIRELRRRDRRTQEALAEAIGVTSQAVSRWEANGGYPDMEMIPSIANYFGITIDELFGYHNNRENKIDAILARVDAYGIKARSDDEWVEECLAILREGLAEFPQNERLLITLADTLSEAGWRRHREWLYYDEEGMIQHNYDMHKRNVYWSESIKICEYLVERADDNSTVTRAIRILVLLYRNTGETDKAIAFARKMPEMKNCREILLASATDGKEEAKYIGEFLLHAARQFSQQLVYGLITNRHHFESDMPIEKIKGAVDLFYLICDDGNLGKYHGDLIQLYLYLSRVQWERGYHDDAFVSLDESLKHARALEAVCDGNAHTFTAPLVAFVTYQACESKDIAKSLPDDWPFWCNPDCSQVEKEIKADPRWTEWVAQTQA
ncbi:MAG: helix-turn-helix transcriptional regulator [Clostridia bacterium]|nr:helix-turn-helix transcriptional regulator [Clostridia bacterium]